MELRRSRRYRILAFASFLWERSDGLLQRAEGAVRDIGAEGVYITADMLPPLGARLDVDVYVSSLEFGGKGIHLHGKGAVVRINRYESTSWGFAAEVGFQTEAASGSSVVDRRKLQ